ncbi:MAG: response regulator [Legionellales bacterium]|nr:response regulator [Legionellales bacterium]
MGPFSDSVQQLKSLFALLGEHQDCVYWLSNPDLSQFIYVSPAFEKIWGIPNAEVYQHPQIWCDAIMRDELAEDTLKKIQAYQQGDFSAQYKHFHIKRPDGEIRLLADHSFPLRDEQQHCIGHCGMTFDLSQSNFMNYFSQRQQALENKNRAMSDLLGNTSHDIKAPLHAILGMAEILNARRHYPDQNEYIHGILESGQLILKLVDELLNFSIIEAGKLSAKYEIFDLKLLIENIIKSIANRAQGKKLKIILNYDHSIPRRIESDPQIIRRIILNLISNAVKFTDKGYVLINVETKPYLADSLEFHLTVKDTGKGMPSDQLNYIFERFYQIPNQEHASLGSGIGLSIAKQMAKILGGDLSVSSQINKGSVFTLTLHAKIHPELPKSFFQHSVKEVMRILVIDDNPERGEILCRHLYPQKAHLSTSKQAITMINRAKQQQLPYSLVIVDDEVDNNDLLTYVLALTTSVENNQTHFIILLQPQHDYLKETLQTLNLHYTISKPLSPSVMVDEIIRLWQLIDNPKINPSPLSSLHVLLVEDDHFSQKVARVILENLQCKIDIADSIQQAISLIQQHQYHLIFLDLGLPDSKGAMSIEKIRELTSTPICVLTANSSFPDPNLILNAGANYFLAKPASQEDFKMIVEKVIAG